MRKKRDYFATSVLSESINLQFDSEGRISLTSKLLKHAKIKNSMLFVGQGKTFQIWEPINFEKFKNIAKPNKPNIIEGTAAIQQFVSIGQHAFIAGGSLVKKKCSTIR